MPLWYFPHSHITKLQKNNPRELEFPEPYIFTLKYTPCCCAAAAWVFFAHSRRHWLEHFSLIPNSGDIIIYSRWILVSHEPLTPVAPAYKTLVLFHSCHDDAPFRRAKKGKSKPRVCIWMKYWHCGRGGASSSFGHTTSYDCRNVCQDFCALLIKLNLCQTFCQVVMVTRLISSDQCAPTKRIGSPS